MLEVEVKIKCSIRETEEKLEKLGFIKGTIVYEKDTYYNSDHFDLKKEDKALRIREHKDVDTGAVKYVLNFKGKKIDDTTMTREETQFEIPSFEQGELIFNGLGFFAAGGVEKTRIHYKKDDVTCCLDSVSGLGEFLEIEIMAEDQDRYADAVEKIDCLLRSLGMDMKDTVRISYLSMLQQD